MTSLCPGPLFGTPGLNHYSTPSSRTDTPTDIKKRFSRVPFNGVPWPKPSPVSKVYDVRNSSTKMILLNSKYSKKSPNTQPTASPMKDCRLRGHTTHDGDIKSPDPDRHASETPHVNRRGHMNCGDAGPAVFKPAVKTNIKWTNTTQRPPMKFEDGSSVNNKRHTSCMGSDDLRHMNWHRPRRPYSTSIIRESMRSRSPLLEDLSPGERLYMYSIARVYSVDGMRRQKQHQYYNLLHKEVKRGVHPIEECQRYFRYLNSPRKTQQGADDSFQRRRVKSAPGWTPRDGSQSQLAGRSTSGTPVLPKRSKSRASTRSFSQNSTASSRGKIKQETKTERGDNSDKPRSRHQEEKKRHEKSESRGAKEDKSDKKPENRSKPQRKRQSENKSYPHPPITQVQIDSSHDDDNQNEAPVRGEDVNDSDSSDGGERTPRHKEGKDRPKSRLGRNRRRNMDDSDDDYSSDSYSSSDESYSEPTSKSDPTSRSEASKSEVTRSEVSKSDASKSEVTRSEASKSEVTRSEVSKSEANKSEVTRSDANKSDRSTSEVPSNSDPGKSEGRKSSTSDATDTTEKSNNNEKQQESTEAKSSDLAPPKNPDASYSEDFTETSASENVSQRKIDEKQSNTDQPSKSEEHEDSKDTSSDESDTTETSSTENVTKSRSSSHEVKDDKVKSDQLKVSDEVKVSDQSYSDDFTESKSSEVKVSEKTERLKEDKEKTTGSDPGASKDRRDSVELDSEGRVRDWDKIEY